MPLPGMDLHQNVERGAHRKRENDRLVKDSMKMTPLQNDVWVPTLLPPIAPRVMVDICHWPRSNRIDGNVNELDA
jgi:hypothetical protein